MTPYTLTTTNRETSLSQFVTIERYPKGLLCRVVCPTIGQREAPIISAEVTEALVTGAPWPRALALEPGDLAPARLLPGDPAPARLLPG